MRPNTRSSKRALGPAVSRVPPHVLSLIFSFNCETPKVPMFREEFMQYNLWRRKAGWRFLGLASLVCRAWTAPAQALLVGSVGFSKTTKVDEAIESNLLERYDVRTLTIASRGKKNDKMTGKHAGQVLAKVKGVEKLLLKSMTGLTTNAIFLSNLTTNLTYLDLQAAIHLVPKKVTSVAAPASIPLKTLILGPDAQPAEFLGQLFSAAKPTLVRLDLHLSKASKPALLASFPLVADSILELSLFGGSGWGGGLGALRLHQGDFLALLKQCVRVRRFGWDNGGSLGFVASHLPDHGGWIEEVAWGYVAYNMDQMLITQVLDKPNLPSLRTIVINTRWGVSSTMEKACRERRIVLRGEQ